MMKPADGLSLRERVFAQLCDIDLYGIATIDEAAGTPLADAAHTLLPGARAMVVLAAELFPEVLRLVEPEKSMGRRRRAISMPRTSITSAAA
jgi:hypothetical protein